MFGVVAALELYAMLIVATLMYATWVSRNTNKAKKIFFRCLLFLFAALGFEAASNFMDGSGASDALQIATNLLSCLFGIFIPGSLCEYMVANMDSDFPEYERHGRTINVLVGLTLIGTVIGVVTGDCFTVENGVYIPGRLMPLFTLVPAVIPLYGLYLIRRFRDELLSTEMVAIGSSILFPVTAVVINYFFPSLVLYYLGMTISVQIMYIALQSKRKVEYKKRESQLIEATRTDSLTGLLNRRAYSEYCKSHEDERNVGVFFFDLNGLKYTNDNYGHIAGDNLLTNFSDFLKQHFRIDCIFRLSGDEFVVIVPNIDSHAFADRQKKIHRELQSSELPIASMGATHAAKGSIEGLVKLAEESMYTDKQIFYSKNPSMIRKR